MAMKSGSKESFTCDSSASTPSEQKANDSNKQKVARVHETFPFASKETIAIILHYYDGDESKTVDAITRDGGEEALSKLAESGSLKSKNNKNKKKKKKSKKDTGLCVGATASFDADDSSSLHSGGNIDADVEKECLRTENGNGILSDSIDECRSTTVHICPDRLNSEVDPVYDNVMKATINDTKILEGSHLLSSAEESSQTLETENTVVQQITASRESPVSDTSEKQSGHNYQKDKSRSNRDDSHSKHAQRQRTSSDRRSKTPSISEDSSSQHNPQGTANPSKRGYEKCKKDLGRQSVSLQRIHSQLEKGLDEAAKKLKNAFNEVRNMLDKRQELLEQEFEKTKDEALNLLKSRRDLAAELKRRVDRTQSLTEAEWSELRSDIKQFVTERKYDEELGKTIWFHWCMDTITESVGAFGEVHPVKNVYSQRSHAVSGSSSISHMNPEPSPSSSLANEEISSSADKNDVGNMSDTVEDEVAAVTKDPAPPTQKNQPSENRTRVFCNKNFNSGRFPPHQNRPNRGFNHNNRNFNFARGNFRNYNYRSNNYYEYSDFRNHPHQDRDGRNNDSHLLSNERNISNPRVEKFRGRAQNSNYRSGNRSNRYRGNLNNRQNLGIPKSDPVLNEKDTEKSNVVNGYANE